jgi:hypothetical protein
MSQGLLIQDLYNARRSRRRVTAKTTAYTITNQDHKAIFTNRGATGSVTFTLPSAANNPGLEVMVYAVAAQNVVVASATTDTMVVVGDATADSVTWSTSGEIIGGGATFISDGTGWLVIPITWDNGTLVTTVTTAT